MESDLFPEGIYRGGFLIKKEKIHLKPTEFHVEGEKDSPFDCIVSKINHFKTNEPFLEIEVYDVVEKIALETFTLNKEQFEKFKEFINKLEF